jgi:hypothetical protein
VSYYVRAFCTTGEPPAIRPILDFAKERGFVVEGVSNATGLDDPAWEQAAVVYKTGKSPILLEINREQAGEDGSLFREEIEEFLEFLEDAPNNSNRKRVEQHLRETRFTVAAQLATSDIDDDGYNALGNMLRYFVEHNGGMIQADGEGFYDGNEVIVALE